MSSVMTGEGIQKRMFLLRSQRVMLSDDPAGIYDIEVRALIQAVKRNHGRFPDDLMFQLSEAEFTDLKSRIVTPSWGGLRRAAPYHCAGTPDWIRSEVRRTGQVEGASPMNRRFNTSGDFDESCAIHHLKNHVRGGGMAACVMAKRGLQSWGVPKWTFGA